jgi:hypothetical protein
MSSEVETSLIISPLEILDFARNDKPTKAANVNLDRSFNTNSAGR